eukprot:1941335-Rhodomonas_salina.1
MATTTCLAQFARRLSCFAIDFAVAADVGRCHSAQEKELDELSMVQPLVAPTRRNQSHSNPQHCNLLSRLCVSEKRCGDE